MKKLLLLGIALTLGASLQAKCCHCHCHRDHQARVVADNALRQLPGKICDDIKHGAQVTSQAIARDAQETKAALARDPLVVRTKERVHYASDKVAETAHNVKDGAVRAGKATAQVAKATGHTLTNIAHDIKKDVQAGVKEAKQNNS